MLTGLAWPRLSNRSRTSVTRRCPLVSAPSISMLPLPEPCTLMAASWCASGLPLEFLLAPMNDGGLVENILLQTVAGEIKFAGDMKARAIRPAVEGNHPRALRVAGVGQNGNLLRRNQRHEIHELAERIVQRPSVAIVKLQSWAGCGRHQPANHEGKNHPRCQRTH